VLTKKSIPTFADAMKARVDIGAKAKCIL